MSFPDPHHDHAHCTADLIARAERVCASKGARLTSQRREVLACVGQSHSAVGAYDIMERMAAHGPRPAPITVYRALDFLLAHELVHKVESRNAFVACAGAHKAHAAALLICETCKTVSEGDQSDVLGLLNAMAATQGFKVRQAVVELTGECSACAAAKA